MLAGPDGREGGIILQKTFRHLSDYQRRVHFAVNYITQMP